ncbi:hypothetical protein LOD99_7947 [Oopsacas minuta]|uniref:Paired domain-containing protein n=1 Tax=Oopsacas minuta TaxID=111878 RepID=A0AAV7JIK6_9METZ|nr:hypothetical protein LOD99_7947 [Oopsacas minuta]
MELRRAAVIQLYGGAGKSKVKIAKLLKTNKMFITRSLSRYNDTGLMTDRGRPARPRTVRTFSRISRVSQRIRRNPSRSIRNMAKEIQISRESMRRIVLSDLQLKAYKLNKCKLLSEQN